MIREDLSFIRSMIYTNVDELKESIHEFDKQLSEALKENNIEKDNTPEDISIEDIDKTYDNIKTELETPEINNLEVYISNLEEIIELVEIEGVFPKNQDTISSPRKVYESNPELFTDINTFTYEQMEKLENYINLNCRQKIKLLRGVYTMDNIVSYSSYGKYKLDKYVKYKELAYRKLENHKLEYLSPNIIELSLGKLFKDKQDILPVIMMKIYMYINTFKQEEALYVYFVILAMCSINNENMLHREEMIEALLSLAE